MDTTVKIIGVDLATSYDFTSIGKFTYQMEGADDASSSYPRDNKEDID